jgi:hypothetical protein
LHDEQTAKKRRGTNEPRAVGLMPTDPAHEQKHMPRDEKRSYDMQVSAFASVSQDCTENELQVEQASRQHAEPLHSPGILDDFPGRLLSPFLGSEQRETHEENEKRLGKTRMDDRQRLL